MSAGAASDDTQDARAFFRDLHGALGRTWDEAHRHGSEPVAAVLSQAWDSFDGNVQIQSEGQPPVDCRKGCATCCSLRVTATAPEVFLIARFVDATAPAYARVGIDLAARLRQADALTRGLSEEARVTLRHMCPFIAQGACTIYRVRPLACRGHASYDRRACSNAAAGRAWQVPFSRPHRLVRSLVQSALQAALRQRRLAHGAYEVNQAVTLALQSPALRDAWLAGDDPLQAAAVDDAAERAAMGEAFDAALAG